MHYLIRRFIALSLTLVAASLIVFAVIEVVPGDPASFMLGVDARPDTLAALRVELGLDQPLAQRYLAWLSGMLQGDFGISYQYRVPVADMIAERLAVSLPLAVYALGLSLAIGLPAGIFAAAWNGRIGDLVLMGGAQLGIALPNFWFAMLLVLIFSVHLGWMSAGGFAGWEAGLLPALKSLSLPAVALALPQAAILARVMRTALIEVLGEDFIRTARAKGLSRMQALYRHGLRNALIPVLTILGLQASFLLAGGIVIEQVFYLPGLGRLIFQSIAARDLIVVESATMLLIFAVIVVNFAVDLAYAIVDPRLGGGRR